MFNIRNLPIEPPDFRPRSPLVAAVENCGAIPEHFPGKEKQPMPKSSAKSALYPASKPVSFPPTLGGNLDLKA